MIFSIEGNIGSGKSTFCKYLKEHFSKFYNKPHGTNVLFVDEPVMTGFLLKILRVIYLNIFISVQKNILIVFK